MKETLGLAESGCSRRRERDTKRKWSGQTVARTKRSAIRTSLATLAEESLKRIGHGAIFMVEDQHLSPSVIYKEDPRSGLNYKDLMYSPWNMVVVERHTMTDDALLFHYTDIDGFLGILESEEFWMSDLQFQNAASELKYGL